MTSSTDLAKSDEGGVHGCELDVAASLGGPRVVSGLSVPHPGRDQVADLLLAPAQNVQGHLHTHISLGETEL